MTHQPPHPPTTVAAAAPAAAGRAGTPASATGMLLLAGAVTCLLLTGCSHTRPAPTNSVTSTTAPAAVLAGTQTAGLPTRNRPPRAGLPPAGTVNGTDPEAVVRWVLTAWYSYDTRTDTDPTDAARRALPWLTPQLAATVAATPWPPSDATWTAWTRSDAYATVRLTPAGDDHPLDTALQIARIYRVDITLHPGTTRHVVSYVQATRTGLADTWHVAAVATQ